MKNKYSISIIIVIIISIFSILLLGFKSKENEVPQEVYNVYLDGSLIGTIESEDSFKEYINEKEEKIKSKYNVENVYTPNGVEIKEEITYKPKISTNEEIYNKIIKKKNFTIKGVVITITDEESNKSTTVNVLSKEIFDEALTNTIKAFVNVEEYNNYINDTQKEIVDTGSIIENIDLGQKVTYKESLISSEEEIYTDVDELAKYLLYGTTESQQKYTVQAGDTIETVAEKNKLNVQEFLIANPDFTSVNNLLYESQEVYVGLIEPIINVVVDYHEVSDEEKKYDTEIQYDETIYAGTDDRVVTEGENGLYRVTRKKQYMNGQLIDTTNVSSTELKPAINRVIVRGKKYAPSVADLSYWAWPTDRPYSITSGYAWRWGAFHNALDISGPGYGSAIYAANNGVVTKVGLGCYPGNLSCNQTQGNYLIINHNIREYHTIYMHMKDIYVKEGQTVARGQKIGTMGNTGNVYPVPNSYNPYGGTHLHFGVYIGTPYAGGYTINPYNLY